MNDDIEKLRWEITNIYANMEGVKLETSTEKYLMRIIREMYTTVVTAEKDKK